MTKYKYADRLAHFQPTPLDLIGDWHPLLKEFKGVVIHDADNVSSNYNYHQYLIERDGELAILYRVEDSVDPFRTDRLSVAVGPIAELWFDELHTE